MIIIISSQGDNLNSQPNFRFGRTPFFIKYDLDKDSWEAFDNPAINESGGAGVAASQFVIDHQAAAVLSGRFGPNAHRVLSSAGIQMFTFDDSNPTVKDVIKDYQQGKLTKIKDMGSLR